MFRQLSILIRKEFKQIFRNPSILAVILISPLMQLLILPLAANYEVKNINLAVVDHDLSSLSRSLVRDITSSGYFRLTYFGENHAKAFQELEKENADLILEIPANFERNMVRESSQKISIGINAINGTKAGLSSAYLGNIIQDFNQNLQPKFNPQVAEMMKNTGLEMRTSLWFNKEYNYRLSLVPGILVFLVTLVAGMLSALNIVAEKEIGTIEQINVSPIRKSNFILGKMIPFWLLAVLVFTLGLMVSRFVYGVHIHGSFPLLYFFLTIYLLAILGYGLLISTFAETQQQAMFINFFFVMIFIMMSGLFTPIESMPVWAQKITLLNPLSYMIDAVRLIMLKDSSIIDLLPQLGALVAMAVVFNLAAIWNYRKTT
ncbi:ABC transporter permease [Chryseobacterium koreense]|uniref:ABC transporter permease n=1 Tax=Chryseobacterium koreense TaxID=232216 RepID=UPI0026EBCD4C|nr:ABC transporter permease [Chryseobacterium koreense]